MPRFTELSLIPPLQRALSELGFAEPTPIQAQSLPALLEGRDLIGKSQTGSGKTLAFGLALLQRVDLSHKVPQAIVLCPTRELADQVARELRRVGRHLPSLCIATLVGGQPFGAQAASLRGGAHLVVGTPGRVLDHLRRHTLSLAHAAQVVLDEADRMLDMGFSEDVEEVLRALPEAPQTILFSATYPDSIAELSAHYQHDPVSVSISAASAPDIEQIAFETTEGEKLAALEWILRDRAPKQALVFCHLKATVVALAEELRRVGGSALALQGDLEQWERDEVMAQFRNESVRVLVATDVAARGIDVAGLDLVVNFDVPKPDIYLHRIGRTGRAGKTGLAISLARREERWKLEELAEVATIYVKPLPSPLPAAAAKAELASASMATFFVGGGRKDKVRPGDILGALTGEAGGLPASAVGKIEIHDRFAYVAIRADVAETALRRLQNGRIKGRKFRVGLVQ